jgi:hypothetical protein
MLEYPVGAVPFILGPRFFTSSVQGYGLLFGALMGLCLTGAVIAALDAARAAREGARGIRTRAWLASGLLLAQGAIAIQRLDAVTALFLALAVRAAVRRRPLAFGSWIGLSTVTKIVPVLLIPAFFASDPQFWRGGRALGRFAVGSGTAIAGGLAASLFFSPHALADVFAYHTARGLNCESMLGFLLAVWRLFFDGRRPSAISFGSYNLDGSCADALAGLCGPLSVGAMLGMAWLVWRSAAGPDPDGGDERPARVACAAFASLVLLWLTAKVFSTQYMTWGIPLVLAIPGRFGLRLAWLLVGAMALTQLYVCGHHELVMQGTPLGLLNLGARQGLLVAAGYLAARRVVGNGERVAEPRAEPQVG